MQTVTMYLRATSVKATLVDEWNQTVSRRGGYAPSWC